MCSGKRLAPIGRTRTCQRSQSHRRIKDHKNLLLWYTVYEFEAYTTGTDIVMQDAYVTEINATHSVVWDTECTPGCGGCGCDKCTGEFKYISQRVNQFGDRSRALGGRGRKLFGRCLRHLVGVHIGAGFRPGRNGWSRVCWTSLMVH